MPRSITDEGSVLLLGAGSSQPFEMPLGASLIDDIRTGLEISFDNGLLQKFRIGQVANDICWPDRFVGDPIGSAIGARWYAGSFDETTVNADISLARKLCSLLNGQTAETIDDFIAHNPTVAELAKLCAAALMLRRSYTWEEQKLRLKPFKARYCGPSLGERNWIHLLVNLVRHAHRLGRTTESNPIRIVTFNYDRILERVLEDQFANTELELPNWKKLIQIVHVHGEFGDLEPICAEPGKVAAKWARGMHVVNEEVDDAELQRSREMAREWIGAASAIFAAGFAFSGSNLRMLNVTRKPGRWIVFCNYDGNVGLRRSVRDIAFSETLVEEASGTSSQPLGISAWLQSGHLGEMP